MTFGVYLIHPSTHPFSLPALSLAGGWGLEPISAYFGRESGYIPVCQQNVTLNRIQLDFSMQKSKHEMGAGPFLNVLRDLTSHIKSHFSEHNQSKVTVPICVFKKYNIQHFPQKPFQLGLPGKNVMLQLS